MPTNWRVQRALRVVRKLPDGLWGVFGSHGMWAGSFGKWEDAINYATAGRLLGGGEWQPVGEGLQ